jgi:hypothetical protein
MGCHSIQFELQIFLFQKKRNFTFDVSLFTWKSLISGILSFVCPLTIAFNCALRMSLANEFLPSSSLPLKVQKTNKPKWNQ